MKVCDDVASIGERVRDAGDTGAADDRRVGTDRAEAVDVVRFLTPNPTAIGTSVRSRSVWRTGASALWSGGPTVPLLPYAETR